MNRWYRRRHWIYAGLITLLGLEVFAFFGWVRQPTARPEVMQAQVAALEREVADLSVEVSRLQRVREQVPTLHPRLEAFVAEHFSSERSGFSIVAADLAGAASQAGVTLETVSYMSEAEEAQPELLRVEIRATVEGRYPNLLRYLEELERSPRFYLVDELEVVGARRRGLRLEMRLATYFRQATT